MVSGRRGSSRTPGKVDGRKLGTNCRRWMVFTGQGSCMDLLPKKLAEAESACFCCISLRNSESQNSKIPLSFNGREKVEEERAEVMGVKEKCKCFFSSKKDDSLLDIYVFCGLIQIKVHFFNTVFTLCGSV